MKDRLVQLTLEQRGFELCGSTYTQIFSSKYLQPFLSLFSIPGFNYLRNENSIFTFPTADFLPQIKNIVESADAKG